MKKLVLAVFVALLAVGLAAPPARAVTTFPPGYYLGSAKDRSNLFSDPNDDDIWTAEGLFAPINAGDEQRNIFSADVFYTGHLVSGADGVSVSEDTLYNGYDNGALTGMVYDLVFLKDSLGNTAIAGPPPITSRDLYFGPGTRYTDMATGTGSDGLWTDAYTPPGSAVATTGGGYGGMLVLYDEYPGDTSFNGNGGGASDWLEPDDPGHSGSTFIDPAFGAAAVSIDEYPSISDPVQPYLIAVITPLPAFLVTPATPAGTVLVEQGYYVNATGVIQATRAIGFANVIGGTAASQFDTDVFGSGLDIRFEFPIGGDASQLIDNWQVESDDDFMFGIIPEPATMSLLGMGLVGLVGAYYKRKKRV
jgi:hypothetical protein